MEYAYIRDVPLSRRPTVRRRLSVSIQFHDNKCQVFARRVLLVMPVSCTAVQFRLCSSEASTSC